MNSPDEPVLNRSWKRACHCCSRQRVPRRSSSERERHSMKRSSRHIASERRLRSSHRVFAGENFMAYSSAWSLSPRGRPAQSASSRLAPIRSSRASSERSDMYCAAHCGSVQVHHIESHRSAQRIGVQLRAPEGTARSAVTDGGRQLQRPVGRAAHDHAVRNRMVSDGCQSWRGWGPSRKSGVLRGWPWQRGFYESWGE